MTITFQKGKGVAANGTWFEAGTPGYDYWRQAGGDDYSTFGRNTALSMGLTPGQSYKPSEFMPRFTAMTEIAKRMPYITRGMQMGTDPQRYASMLGDYDFRDPTSFYQQYKEPGYSTMQAPDRAYYDYIFGKSNVSPFIGQEPVSPYLGSPGRVAGGTAYGQAQRYLGGGVPTAATGGGQTGQMPTTESIYFGMMPKFESPRMEEYYRQNYGRIWSDFMSGIYKEKFGDVDFSKLSQEEIGNKMLDYTINPQQILGEFQAYLKEYPWEENYINIPAQMKGEYQSRLAPKTRWLY